MLQLFLISQIKSNPLKACWKVSWRCANICNLSILDWAILLGHIVTCEVMHWLLVPELMLSGKFHPVYELFPLVIVQLLIVLQLGLAELHQLHPLHVVDLFLGWG